MPEPLFTDFVRDHRPLPAQLHTWSRTARDNVHLLKHSDFEVASDEELVDRLVVEWVRQTTPPLQRVGPPSFPDRPAHSERRDPDGAARPPVWRWTATFQLHGNTDLIAQWPSGLSADVCGSDLYHLPVPEMVWQLVESGAVVHLDVLRQDDPEGRALPKERIVRAAEYLDAAIEAANREVHEYDKALRAELLQRVAVQRDYLGVVNEQIAKVAEMLRADELPLAVTAAPVLGAPAAEAEGGRSIMLDLVVEERTFADLIAVTRKWGAAVERYPRAFGSLEEEMLSSLLVPTLNVAFDIAHREVFSVQGKTDIFVESVRGNRESAAFFGEAKIWGGPGQVDEDVPQVFRYTNARAGEAMLLYYVKRANLELTQRRCREAIEQVDGFAGWDESEGLSIALFQHPRFGQRVAITIVYVHIPHDNDAADDD